MLSDPEESANQININLRGDESVEAKIKTSIEM